MGAVFTVAASYMPLKIGQGVTSDTPIAAIAIGLAAVLGRKNVLGENTMMQCIGSTGSMVNSGILFVMPALIILQIQTSYSQFVWTTLMGGVLGIAYAIILRNYFVEHMHGRYPFPGSLATTQILLSGSQGGGSLKIILHSSIVGGLLDFATNSFGWWNSVFTSRVFGWGDQLASLNKIVFSVDIEASVLAVGYMTGLRYAAIIAAGSAFGWWGLIPLINFFADGQAAAVGTNVIKLIKDMSPEEIFRNYVRFIGIGTLAMSGFLGVVKMSPFIKIAFREAFTGILRPSSCSGQIPRTRRDIPKSLVVGLIALAAIVFAVIMRFGYTDNWLQAVLITVVLLVGSFLFAVVGTTSLAFTATEPVSGLTLLTLIIGAQAMLSAGLFGNAGIMVVMLMSAVVCSCLFMTGCFVGDLKTAFWLGITPRKMQIWKLVGVVFSAFISAGVVIVLAESYGFSGEGALVAPQANAMAAVINPIMSGQAAPWTLYVVGAVIAVCLEMVKVPSLAFGLGLYIPLELNMPLLIGGIIAHIAANGSKDNLINKLRHHRGILISSGFIAGGSLTGVLSAVLRIFDYDFAKFTWGHSSNPEFWSLIVYSLLCMFFIGYIMKIRSNE